MELILTIIAALGALLFLFGYLAYVGSGFKHHFVTGLISIFPVLNIVTVPALWHKTSKKLIISVLGVALLGGSWFMGADKGISKTLALIKGESTQETVVASNPSIPLPIKQSSGTTIASGTTTISAPTSNQTTASKPYANQQRFIDESKMQGLPGKALYRMTFEAVPVNKISTLTGRVIQITTNNNVQHEGRVVKVLNSSVFLKQKNTVVNELPIANIKQLFMMVKKAN